MPTGARYVDARKEICVSFKPHQIYSSFVKTCVPQILNNMVVEEINFIHVFDA